MKELINKIAQCLVADAASNEWNKIRYELVGVSTFWQESAELLFNGDSESIETTDDDEDPNNSPMYYAKELRQAMYNEAPGKGAWYTLDLTIDVSGKFDIKFDYDQKPGFNIEIEEERYVWDYEQYPRDSDSTPDWLKQILVKNQK